MKSILFGAESSKAKDVAGKVGNSGVGNAKAVVTGQPKVSSIEMTVAKAGATIVEKQAKSAVGQEITGKSDCC
jgi:hypothetical protein